MKIKLTYDISIIYLFSKEEKSSDELHHLPDKPYADRLD